MCSLYCFLPPALAFAWAARLPLRLRPTPLGTVTYFFSTVGFWFSVPRHRLWSSACWGSFVRHTPPARAVRLPLCACSCLLPRSQSSPALPYFLFLALSCLFPCCASSAGLLVFRPWLLGYGFSGPRPFHVLSHFFLCFSSYFPFAFLFAGYWSSGPAGLLFSGPLELSCLRVCASRCP